MNNMSNSRSLSLCLLASVFLFTAASSAQQVGPAVRIVSPIDESQRVTLTHTVSPLANAANDRGAAPDGMQLDRMQLVLQRSPAQETALQQLIVQMHTPGTPSYHQWLTPDQFGAQFGSSDQDIATIESWLGSHGFAVSKVNPGKATLEFSGSVAQLRDAFHTQIHKYVVDGETHYANANDPQIPAALAPVIGGFASLNNFHPKSYVKKLGKASLNPATHQVSQWTWGNSTTGTYYILAPGDFAIQYDLQPLYNANVNGTGQTIAIINDSNINVDLVNQFRTLFGLPANPPQVIIDGNDPGVDGVNNPDGPNYDSVEAYLDVEWSGAVAPDAAIDLVIGADTALESGLILAMEHAVYGDVAPVISLSFGECESQLGSANSFLNGLWEQAAAQGQTAMVSAGDAGSAGCDDDNIQPYALSGQAVSGFASTPYNVAVGGTDFYYSDYASGGASIANYWSTTTSQLPAVSLNAAKAPIPEQPWNDSQYGLNIINNNSAAGTTIAGGGGGASNGAICSNNTYSTTTGVCTGTLSGYPKPSWQSGNGVPSDSVRDIPDVSLYSANGANNSFYPICATDGDCQTSGLGVGDVVQIYGVGGTSASSPAFAGIMALVVEKWGRQGQADNILYALKTQYPAAFHDVTVGTNSVPCEEAPTVSPSCIAVGASAIVYGGVTEGQIGTGTTPEYNAAAGYNLATGLGTIDANNLITDWPKVVLASTTTTMTPSQTNFAHGTAITISGTVTGSSPTGNVALMTDSSEQVQQGQGLAQTLNGFVGTYGSGTFALSSGSYTGSVSTLPGGSYHIWGQYGGDSKNAMSTSAPPIAINVTPENSGIFFSALSPSGSFTAPQTVSTAIDYGTQMDLSAQIAPSSQLSSFSTCTTSCPIFTIPTGTVTFADSSTNIDTAVVNAEGDAEYNAPFAVGAHTVSANYSGDNSYNKSTSPAISFTVAKDSPDLSLYTTLTTTQNDLISGTGQQTILTVEISNNAQSSFATSSATYPVPVAPPTGTVTLSGSTLSALNGTVALSPFVDPTTSAQSGVANFVVPANTATGNYSVAIAYSGDGNYNSIPVSANTTYTLPIENLNTDSELPSTTIATTTGSISPNTSITVSGTVTGQSGHPAPTNGVYVFSSGAYLGEVGFSSTSGIASSFAFALSSQDLVQGSNYITLQYSGDTVYNPSTFVLYTNTPLSSPRSDFSLVPDFTIVPVSVSAGASSGTDTINVSSVNSFNGVVNLTCTATTPLTCTISPNPSVSSGNPSTATLTINVPASTPNHNYNVLVTGKDAATGEFVHTLAITADVSGSGPAETLTNSGNITVVQGATTSNTSVITVTPSDGFTGIVNLTCAVTTAPAGAANPLACATADLNPDSVNITGTGALTSVLSAVTTGTTTPGSYAITVTGTSGALVSTTVVNVTVNQPQDFSLSPSGPIVVNAGATTGNSTTITLTPLNGFSSTVSLSCAVTTAPQGAANPLTCGASNLNPTSIDAGTGPLTSTLTASTTAATTTGAYVITVTGMNGSDTHTTTVNVTVNASAVPAYTVSATSPSSGISPGNQAISTVTVQGSGGYTGSVTLVCIESSGPQNQTGNAPACDVTYSSGSAIALSGATTSGQATATVVTVAATADLVRPSFGKGKGWLGAGSGAVLALLLFFGVPARRRGWRSMLGIIVAMAVIGVLSSCGGGSGGGGGTGPSNPGTAAGAYTFTVTASGTPAVTPAPTTTFTVSVN